MSSHKARIRFGETYALKDYVVALGALEKVLQRRPSRVVLDFTATKLAYPDGVLPLIATLSRLQSEFGFWTDIEPPQHETLRGVFEGVDWTRYLSTGSDDFHGLPRSTKKFTPARPFHNSVELQRLHESMMEVIVMQAPLATNLPEAIWWGLSELMENVLNHAMSGGGWVQASTFPKARQIAILVVDSGIGIRTSLESAYPGLSDPEAIKKAVEEGATRDPEVGAGYGLTGCRKIVELNFGRMIVYSGKALFTETTKRISPAPGDPRREKTLGQYAPVAFAHQGTIVELQLRTDRAISLEEAFRTGAIPPLVELTHGFEGEITFDVKGEALNLATREAGRALRNKVVNLTAQVPDERIVLDFSGAEMVSSSFADEFVAKVAKELGRDRFWRRFELRGMNKSVGTIVWGVLSNRVGRL